MEKCPICLSDSKDSNKICNCGYDFDQGIVDDEVKIREHLNKLSKFNWIEEIKTKKRITDIHTKVLGRPSTNQKKRGWSKKRTSELLKESQSLTSTDIKLAEYLENHPDIGKSKNKSEAKKRWNQEVKGYPIKESPVKLELDLQSYLLKNWNKISEFDKWELIEGWYNTYEVGVIDLLAKHQDDPKWLVIELKLDQSSDRTMGQLLRYIGWVKKKKAKENEVVEGLIISENSDLEGLRYSLEALEGKPFIKIMNYEFENDQLVLCDFNTKYLLNCFDRMSEDEQNRFMRKFEKL